ncbi:MAG: YkgJ family cysteine cluster protein [Planctomycetota bacterium]|jgi:Fe-S-cluster containining protein
MEIIGLELDILGGPVNLRICAGPEPASLADIVPLARTVCKKITDVVIEKARQKKDFIPCRPGCAACCHYLVPLSVPEAFKLAEEALAAPESRRMLMQRLWLLAARRILRQEPPHVPTGSAPKQSVEDKAEQNAISDWYRNLKLTCPFLSGRMCSIYEMRPLACREYFVTGSEKGCATGCGIAEKIQIPVRTAEVLAQLAAELEGTGVEAVMLPLVLVWHADNLDRAKHTWPAIEMVGRFVEIVKETASGNSVAAVANSKSQRQIDAIQDSRHTHKSPPTRLKLSNKSHHDAFNTAVV